MSGQLKIQTPNKKGDDLSKEQKKFNQHVAKIKNLRIAIENAHEQDMYLRREVDARMIPVETRMLEGSHRLVMALHNTPLRHELTAKQTQKFTAIMLEEVKTLLETTVYSEDTELHNLYNHYNEGRSYADEQAEEEAQMKRMASEMLNNMFGMDLDSEDFDDPEKLHEKVQEKKQQIRAEQAAAEEAYEQKKAERKKTPAQLAAEAKRAAAEQAINQTARQIYFDLVKNFHPDREPDEEKRAEKTEIMKQITSAYEADDHLRLLELQMNLLSRDNVFAQYNDGQLKYFNEILKRQMSELQDQLAMAMPYNNGNPYADLYHPVQKVMKHNIDQQIKNIKYMIRVLDSRLEAISTVKGLKQYVKEYELPDADDDFDFMPPNWMFSGR
jgi:hypothetical protein